MKTEKLRGEEKRTREEEGERKWGDKARGKREWKRERKKVYCYNEAKTVDH